MPTVLGVACIATVLTASSAAPTPTTVHSSGSPAVKTIYRGPPDPRTPTPQRIILLATPDAPALWLEFCQCALRADCGFLSRIAPRIAIVDSDSYDIEALKRICWSLPWVAAAEADVPAQLPAAQPIPLPNVCPDPALSDALFTQQWYIRNFGQPFGSVPPATPVAPATGQFSGTPGSDTHVACAWSTTLGKPEIIIAVIDSGVDANHPDLAGAFAFNQAELNGAPGVDDDGNGKIDDVCGWDFYDNDNDARFFDCTLDPTCPDPSSAAFEHGTPCAGIIAAAQNNAAGITGCAPKCRIMPLKTVGDDPISNTPGLGHMLMALDYAASNHARIASCSWVFAGEYAALKEMCRSVGERGMLVVCAAGNEGVNVADPATLRTPALYGGPAPNGLSNVVSVAGTFAHDELCITGTCSYSSNFSKQCVTLAAPGYQLWSTSRLLDAKGTPYILFGGTSGATPIVAAIAGLTAATHPTWTPAQIKERMLQKCRPVQGLLPAVASGGVIDAEAAVSP